MSGVLLKVDTLPLTEIDPEPARTAKVLKGAPNVQSRSLIFIALLLVRVQNIQQFTLNVRPFLRVLI